MIEAAGRAITGKPARLRILFFALCYAPEEVSGAVLITQLAEDLAERGHEVTVVTTVPSYPLGKVLLPYRNRLMQRENRNGVRVIRVWSRVTSSKKPAWKMVHQASFCFFSLLGAIFAPRADLVYSYSPPLPLGLSAWFVSLFHRCPWVLQLEDIFPDAAVQTGMLKNPLAISFFSRMERFLYRRAARISVISAGFRQNLIAKGVPSEKITLIPAWADGDLVRPMAKRNAFSQENRLEDQFVVMYAGNLGVTSCPDEILAAAVKLIQNPQILFLIIGEGSKKESLESAARNLKLTNIRFLPYQPKERLAEVLASANVHLILLDERSAQTSMPSKAFNIMAASRPAIAVAPFGCELARLVKNANFGFVVPPNHADQVARQILELKHHPELAEWMGRNGRMSLEKEFSRAVCVSRQERMILAVSGERRVKG